MFRPLFEESPLIIGTSYITIYVIWVNSGELKVNRRWTFQLANYQFKWVLLKNGLPIQSDTFSIALAPSLSIEVKLDKLVAAATEDYMLNLFAYTKNASLAIPVGHEVAREQFGGNSTHFFSSATMQEGKLSIEKMGNSLLFKSGPITGNFNIKLGKLMSYQLNEKSLIINFPEPYFWRAPTDNDFGKIVVRQQ